MNNRLQKNNGFTLIEVMVVISILGILAAFFGTSMVQRLPDYRFNNYMRQVHGALQNARLMAVKSNADVFVQFDKSNNSFRAFLDNTDDAANRGFLDSGDTTIEAPKTPSGVVFTQLFGTGDPLVVSVFNSRGFSDRAGEVRMKNGSNSYKGVNLTLGGSSRIIKSGDGGSTWQ